MPITNLIPTIGFGANEFRLTWWCVMAGLVPAIHVFAFAQHLRRGMPATGLCPRGELRRVWVRPRASARRPISAGVNSAL